VAEVVPDEVGVVDAELVGVEVGDVEGVDEAEVVGLVVGVVI
jgi:hypothetical protein